MAYHELEKVELTNMCAIIDEKNRGQGLHFQEDMSKKEKPLSPQQFVKLKKKLVWTLAI